jgi:hypothetical protein
MAKLTDWMKKNYTSPELARWIVIRLNAWRTGSHIIQVYSQPIVNKAIKDQDKIGWWQFLLGRVSKSMTTAQAQYLKIHKPQRKSESWIKGLLTQTWEISFAMWEHRNHALHGDALTPTQELELEALRQQVIEEFTKGATTVQSNLRWMLNQDHKEWAMTQSIPKTKRWLETITLSRKAQVIFRNQLNTTLARQQQRMREWLQQVPQPGV